MNHFARRCKINK